MYNSFYWQAWQRDPTMHFEAIVSNPWNKTSVAEFIDPWLGDKINSSIGSSYAGVDFIPQSGIYEFGYRSAPRQNPTVLWICLQMNMADRGAFLCGGGWGPSRFQECLDSSQKRLNASDLLWNFCWTVYAYWIESVLKNLAWTYLPESTERQPPQDNSPQTCVRRGGMFSHSV